VEEKARGRVKIYNSFSSSPQTLVGGTRFLTDKGLLFRLPQTVSVPGAQVAEGKIVPKFLEVELIADQSGEGANISGKITLRIPGFKGTPKYDGFYAVAEQGFSGGFKGEVNVVSAEDKKRAEEEVTRRVWEEIKQEISQKVPPAFKLVDALKQIEIVEVDSPAVGTRQDKFKARAKAKGAATVFREEEMVSLVKRLVLGENKSKEYVEGSAVLNYRLQTLDGEKGKAEVVLSGDLKIRNVVPVEELVAMIKGQKEGSIIESLKKREELASFRVSFFPPWLFSAPNDTAKIRIVVEK